MYEIIRLALGYLVGIARFRWLIVIVPAVASPVGWFYVASMPDTFTASAKVFVDTDSVLQPLMQGLAVRMDDHRRIQMMTRLLFGRSTLEKLARMTDLDLRAKNPRQMDEVIDELKNKVQLQRQRGDIYRLAYTDSDPALAKKVVQSFLTIFVETNLGESRKDQDSAEQFLVREIKEYERRMVDAERKLKEFKARNLPYLSDRGGYYSRLQKAKNQLAAAKLDLQVAEERQEELQDQLDDLESGDAGALSASDTPLSPLDARIQKLQKQVNDLLLRYTERHPEVITLRRTIARLKKRKAEQEAAAKAAGQGEADDEAAASERLAQNPVYQQMRLLVSEADADVASKKAILKEYQRRIKSLQAEVDRVLQVETEQKQLNRDYGLISGNYHKLTQSLEKLRLGRQVDTHAETVRFRVLEPPMVPDKPSGPPRILYSSMVFFGSLLGGVALAFILSLFRPTFFDRKQLGEVLELPVLGSVNFVWTDREKRRQRRGHLLFGLSLLSLFLAYAGVVAVYQLDIDIVSHLRHLRG